MSPRTAAASAPVTTSNVPFYDLAPAHAPLLDQFERTFREIIKSSAFIGGQAVEDFEVSWAAYCGVKHAVGVANGTDSIELILRGLGIGPGDEVIVPANTFVATAEAVLAAGAVPRFVGVDPGTLLLTADEVRTGLRANTAAIIAVHLYGQPAPMDELHAVSTAAGVALIEDAAQAHGATWEGKPVGGLGTAGSFSFYPGKNLGALGDAGIVVTNDAALASRVRILANHGRAAGHHDHAVCGRNSRLDGLQAALLSCKLPHLDSWNSDRRRLAKLYEQSLTTSGIRMVKQDPRAASAYHLLVGLVDDRDNVRKSLDRRGIGTSIHYPLPCHRQPAFGEFYDGYLPIVERAAARIVSLPIYPGMADNDVGRVCQALHEVIEGEIEVQP